MRQVAVRFSHGVWTEFVERRRRCCIRLHVLRQLEVYLQSGRGGTTRLDHPGARAIRVGLDHWFSTARRMPRYRHRNSTPRWRTGTGHHIKQQTFRSQRDIRPSVCFNRAGKLPLRRLQDSMALALSSATSPKNESALQVHGRGTRRAAGEEEGQPDP